MIGQRFLVHAGKSFDPREVASAVHAAKTIVPKLDVYKMVREAQSTLGGIVGDVLLTECVESSRSPWFGGPFGFLLASPRRCKFDRIPGRLGFFNFDGPIRCLVFEK